MVRVTFMMNEPLKKRFHMACIANSENMSERVTRLVEQWLEQQGKPKKDAKK